ncbi:MAG: CvpA family protein [Spirochaetales bacterium]|nr:CvpA family protein [Spirochaetales bacterium]
MDLSVLDIVLLAVMLISSLAGAFKGFIKELFSLASLFISLLLAAVFYSDGAQWIQSRSSIGDIAALIAFAGIFLASFALFKLLQKMFSEMIEQTPFEGVDKMLGFFLGLLEGILLVFLIVYIINFQTIIDVSDMRNNSVLVPYIERFLPALDKSAAKMIDKISSGSL